MAKKQTTPVEVKKVVKKAGYKVLTQQEAKNHQFYSKKDTRSLRNEAGELIYTDAQLVAEGLRVAEATKFSFQKTKAEREALKRVHSSAKGPRGGIPKKTSTKVSNLIVHVSNPTKENTYKTTYGFKDVAESDVHLVMATFFGNCIENAKDNKEVVKYYHGGTGYTL